MNYSESALILKEIKKAKRVIINCHRSPDPDSIGSALAMRLALLSLNKEVKLICPSQILYENLNYLAGYDEIIKSFKFKEHPFAEDELLVTLDSSSWEMVTGDDNKTVPVTSVIVIDHHLTNKRYGFINLVDEGMSSVGELLFKIFEDFGINFTKDISDCLLAAIIGDTGSFKYPNTTSNTLLIASKLIEFGADKDRHIFSIYQNDSINLIHFKGMILSRIDVDKIGNFAWSAMNNNDFKSFGSPPNAREKICSLFAQAVSDTDFGLIMLEEEKDVLKVSLRSRTGFDTTKIAAELGGGGHKYASGCSVEGLEFRSAVEKVLGVCRKYASEAKKGN